MSAGPNSSGRSSSLRRIYKFMPVEPLGDHPNMQSRSDRPASRLPDLPPLIGVQVPPVALDLLEPSRVGQAVGRLCHTAVQKIEYSLFTPKVSSFGLRKREQ